MIAITFYFPRIPSPISSLQLDNSVFYETLKLKIKYSYTGSHRRQKGRGYEAAASPDQGCSIEF